MARSTKRKDKAEIADRGREAAAAKAKSTRQKLRDAMKAIEIDIEQNDGLYPHAKGEVSTSEVLRRAGLSQTLLQKSRHHEVREEIAQWVTRVRRDMKRGRKLVRKAVTERVDAAKEELQQIMQRWTQVELEFAGQAHKNAELEKKCQKLENENAELRALLAGENVVAVEMKNKRS